MKKLEELVDELNENVIGYDSSPYYVNDDQNGLMLMYYSQTLIMFMSNGWRIKSGMSTISDEKQKMIMEFAMSTTSEDWFPEKKYYIAIGQYDYYSKLIYYKKNHNSGFSLCAKIDFNEEHLKDNEIFTEKQIEELKDTLPENMQEIVEMGKVEV